MGQYAKILLLKEIFLSKRVDMVDIIALWKNIIDINAHWKNSVQGPVEIWEMIV